MSTCPPRSAGSHQSKSKSKFSPFITCSCRRGQRAPPRSSDTSLTHLRFASYAESMLEVENAKVKTKAEADKILQKVEPVCFP